MASNVVVNILGNNSSLNRTLSQSQGRMSKFGSAMKTAGKVGGLAIATGAVVAGKALFDMTKAAIDDEAAQKKLAFALKANAGATKDQIAQTESWITAQGKATGVADDDLRPALGRLVTATKDVYKAQELVRLGMDVSAGSGASLESVTKALAKAQNGSVAGLAKFGINIKNAKGETVSFEVAQRRLSNAFRGQAEVAANTTAGKLGRLKLMLSELGEEIGAKLIPVVTQMADWFLAKGLPAIEAFGGWMRDNIPPIIEKVRTVIQNVFGGGGGGGIGDTIREAWITIKSVFQDAISIIQSLWKAFGKNIVAFAKGYFSSIIQIIKGAFQIIRGVFKVVSSLLKGDWKGVWKGIQLILKGAANVLIGLIKNMWNLIKFAFKNAGVILKAILKAAWDGLVNLAKTGARKLIELVQDIPGKIRNLGSKMLEAGKAMMGKLFDGIKAAVSGVAGFASDIANSIKSAINNALNLPFTIHGPGPLPDFTIPAFARGGIVTGPTLALIGEAGPEAVVPLREKGNLGFGNTYIIHQHVAPTASLVDAGRELVKAIEAFEGAGGRVVAR